MILLLKTASIFRVAEMEKKKDETVKHQTTKHFSESKSVVAKEDSDDDEEDFEEFLDWRNKK